MKSKLEQMNDIHHDYEWILRSISDLGHFNSKYISKSRTGDKSNWWNRIKKLFASTDITVDNNRIHVNPVSVCSNVTIDPSKMQNDDIAYMVAIMRSDTLDFMENQLKEVKQKIEKKYKSTISNF